MPELVPPHGSDVLMPLLAPAAERATEIARAEGLKKIPMTSREVSDLLMLGMGAYTPLSRRRACFGRSRLHFRRNRHWQILSKSANLWH